MTMSDDFRIEMWSEVLDLCRVTSDENVVVLTSESSHPQNIEAAMRALAKTGASLFRLELPPKRARGPVAGERLNVQTTPLTGQRLATDVLKQADMVVDLMGLLHSPEQTEILAAGTRMLMVIEPPEILARMMPSRDDKRRVQAADERLRRAKTMTVTSKAGTRLVMQLGQFPTLPEYGYADEPGHWDHWPSGFISTWPNEGTASGEVVIDIGDMLFPFKAYVQSAPITISIRDGVITSIEGGFEAKYLRQHMESYNDPNAFAVSHVGWGLQPKAKWGGLGMRDKFQSLGMDARAYYGNFLFSTGPNSEAGGANNSQCHVDIPMAACSVSLDGEPITIEGDVVAADQRVTG
jgi:2,5-dihydroxypyridine 5,6-dioxygenase